ncbi:ATP-binding protein [Methylobacterium brachythecii]|uniref:Anti-sigma regulatory factor (Ser/Thr protein kinase) n=1 Tax=Methylobacterium brachythecii TaxID=1176177 RepID=A0A7W6AL30_9HYPH|nr:ATP-binding protein [Methylobacterium brachythecii]MBB3902746.1 anti-sigma regulatory factor (Ser/Thr protein kinase) [Methylobacterium brachythecii]GLS42588.1 transcriptional regulator [Methylobacterium brachythecii]
MDRVTVTEASQVAEARRRAVAAALSIGFDETACGRAAIVVTELATNVVKYGVPGEILVGIYEDGTGTGLEILALDKGAGFPDLGAALRDGHSTGGSAGEGLGAVKRLSNAFDIVSRPGSGTAVLVRLSGARGARSDPSDALPAFSAVTVPLKGETANGDAYAVHERVDGWTAIVADGLGHGPDAAKASEEAMRLFRRHHDKSPTEILVAVHAGLSHTRGGAVSVARHARDTGTLTFAGIGNVAGAVVSGPVIKRTVSLAGTAGHAARRIQEFEYPMQSHDLFVLCSDGIATGWHLDGYPGLAAAHPALVAGVIFRDFARARDDATVLVVRGDAP